MVDHKTRIGVVTRDILSILNLRRQPGFSVAGRIELGFERWRHALVLAGSSAWIQGTAGRRWFRRKRHAPSIIHWRRVAPGYFAGWMRSNAFARQRPLLWSPLCALEEVLCGELLWRELIENSQLFCQWYVCNSTLSQLQFSWTCCGCPHSQLQGTRQSTRIKLFWSINQFNREHY